MGRNLVYNPLNIINYPLISTKLPRKQWVNNPEQRLPCPSTSFIYRAIATKKRETASLQSPVWYPERDLNPHDPSGQQILSLSCLPIPPSRQLASSRPSKFRPKKRGTVGRLKRVAPPLRNGHSSTRIFTRVCGCFGSCTPRHLYIPKCRLDRFSQGGRRIADTQSINFP